jgi:hypothetical protein
MAKALAGVKYGKLTSRKPPRNTKNQARMSGRSGPPPVDIGGKQERKPTGPSSRFAKTGSVSERHSHSGPSDHPSIGSQKGHGSFASLGIPKTPQLGKLDTAG